MRMRCNIEGDRMHSAAFYCRGSSPTFRALFWLVLSAGRMELVDSALSEMLVDVRVVRVGQSLRRWNKILPCRSTSGNCV